MTLTLSVKRLLSSSLRTRHVRSLLNDTRSRLTHITTTHNSMSSTMSQHTTSKRFVYRSLSNDIFENLALEEWIYEQSDFSQTDVLLMWQSDPCVVIGKHQNPWIEANIPVLQREGIQLARRSSGGGTVYHDKGNLNLSFLKDRSRYNRRENLELVVAALTSKWDLDLVVNDRDDIILDGEHKISGTAAKLTRDKSYHHFTLLHSVDRRKLSACLASSFRGHGDTHARNPGVSIHSRSTMSVPAPIQNLQARASAMTMDLLMEVIVNVFLEENSVVTEPIIFVNPLDESLFPGVNDIRERLQSWDWVFGKTPKFSIKIDLSGSHGGGDDLVQAVDIGIEKGRLASFVVVLNNAVSVDLADLFDFKGVEFTRENLTSLLQEQNLYGAEELPTSAFLDFDAKCVLESVRSGVSEFLSGSIS